MTTLNACTCSCTISSTVLALTLPAQWWYTAFCRLSSLRTGQALVDGDARSMVWFASGFGGWLILGGPCALWTLRWGIGLGGTLRARPCLTSRMPPSMACWCGVPAAQARLAKPHVVLRYCVTWWFYNWCRQLTVFVFCRAHNCAFANRQPCYEPRHAALYNGCFLRHIPQVVTGFDNTVLPDHLFDHRCRAVYGLKISAGPTTPPNGTKRMVHALTTHQV